MASVDAKIAVKVTPNKLRATVNYTPPSGGGNPLMPSDVNAQLKSMGITTGINRENIDKICQSEHALVNIILAEGFAPTAGDNARLEMIINIKRSGKAKELADGSVDFYELGEITSAETNQELYRKIPPTRGEPGKDIFGAEIPGILGRDLNLVLGKGTKIDGFDPNLVRAATDGEVLFRKGLISISEIHTVQGDVDFSTGNIRFKGTVRIGGTVKSGFQVIGDGNIEISGNVEDAIITGGNDVIIHGGLAGSGEGVVKAKQDVYVKFIENQHIEADRDIVINGESFHATLQAGRSIFAKGQKGLIVGGTCEAKFSVEAKIFGSVACTPTMIKVGTNPKLAERISAIEAEIVQSEESLKKLEQSLIYLYRQKIDNNNVLSPDKATLLEKLEAAKKTLPDTIETLTRELGSLQQTKEDIEKASAIAEHAVHPKVRVYIGQQWITIEDTLGPSRFKIVGGDVVRISS